MTRHHRRRRAREVEHLRRWKAEALEVLAAWDEVAEAVYAHRSPRLGTRHSTNVMAFVRDAIAAADHESGDVT